jgi:hypothetical protein
MRAAFLIGCVLVGVSTPARAQIDLHAPRDRAVELADALRLEIRTEVIERESACPGTAARAFVCVAPEDSSVRLVVGTPDSGMREAVLPESVTARTIAVVAVSLLAERSIEIARAAEPPSEELGVPGAEDAAGARPAPSAIRRVRLIGGVGAGAMIVLGEMASAVGPTVTSGLGIELFEIFRAISFASFVYPIAIQDARDLWFVRGGLSLGARIDFGDLALLVAARASGGVSRNPERICDPEPCSREPEIIPLASGGGSIGLAIDLMGTDLVVELVLEGMAREIRERAPDALIALTAGAEWR